MALQFLDKTGLTKVIDWIKTSFVKQETGKGLSTNDYTTAEKNKLKGVTAGAQPNKIESIKVNGAAQTITSKAVDIKVPTKTSELTNDSTFMTKAQVDALVKALNSLSIEVVTALPATGKTGIIYLAPNPKSGAGNLKSEYMWIDGKFELIGDAAPVLTNYATKAELKNYALASSLAAYAKKTDLNNYALKTDVEAITAADIDALLV